MYYSTLHNCQPIYVSGNSKKRQNFTFCQVDSVEKNLMFSCFSSNFDILNSVLIQKMALNQELIHILRRFKCVCMKRDNLCSSCKLRRSFMTSFDLLRFFFSNCSAVSASGKVFASNVRKIVVLEVFKKHCLVWKTWQQVKQNQCSTRKFSNQFWIDSFLKKSNLLQRLQTNSFREKIRKNQHFSSKFGILKQETARNISISNHCLYRFSGGKTN